MQFYISCTSILYMPSASAESPITLQRHSSILHHVMLSDANPGEKKTDSNPKVQERHNNPMCAVLLNIAIIRTILDDLGSPPPAQLLLPSSPLDDGPKSLCHLLVDFPLKIHNLQSK